MSDAKVTEADLVRDMSESLRDLLWLIDNRGGARAVLQGQSVGEGFAATRILGRAVRALSRIHLGKAECKP